MNPSQESPQQEAVSLISIAAILLSVVAYAAAANNIPVISPLLFCLASAVYQFFPALNGIHGAQMPMLISAFAVGGVFWLLALPFSGMLAQLFSAGNLSSIQRQTDRLKRNRIQIMRRRRDKDDFNAT
jgi:hypothetical protein